MRKIRFLSVILILCLLSPSMWVCKVYGKVSQTEVSKYALSWKDNTKIPYVYGGGRGYGSLEELEKAGAGTDCSGFVSLVYKHFGIDIPAQSEAMKSVAKKVITNEKDAVPGDIVWWYGHVGIYIGNGKIVHTNTPSPPTNFPHVSIFAGEGANYNPPSAYLRMVDDVKDLKPLKGDDKEDTEKKVTSSNGTGSIVTTSDIDGMPIESTLIAQQKAFELKGLDNLTLAEQETLAYMKDYMYGSSYKIQNIGGTVLIAIGIALILYSILLLVCYILDYTNVFIDFSFLSLISFGKFRIVEEEFIDSGAVHSGWDERRKVIYLTSKMVVVRVVIIFLVGMMLISGIVPELVATIVERFRW